MLNIHPDILSYPRPPKFHSTSHHSLPVHYQCGLLYSPLPEPQHPLRFLTLSNSSVDRRNNVLYGSPPPPIGTPSSLSLLSVPSNSWQSQPPQVADKGDRGRGGRSPQPKLKSLPFPPPPLSQCGTQDDDGNVDGPDRRFGRNGEPSSRCCCWWSTSTSLL